MTGVVPLNQLRVWCLGLVILSIFLPSPPDVQPADMDLCSLVQAGPHQKAPFCVAFGCVCGSVTACIGRVSSPPSRTPVWRVWGCRVAFCAPLPPGFSPISGPFFAVFGVILKYTAPCSGCGPSQGCGCRPTPPFRHGRAVGGPHKTPLFAFRLFGVVYVCVCVLTALPAVYCVTFWGVLCSDIV